MMRYKVKYISIYSYPLLVLGFLEVVGNASFAPSFHPRLLHLMLHILSFFVHRYTLLLRFYSPIETEEAPAGAEDRRVL